VTLKSPSQSPSKPSTAAGKSTLDGFVRSY